MFLFLSHSCVVKLSDDADILNVIVDIHTQSHRKTSVFLCFLCQISNVWLERDKVTYMIYSIFELDQTNIIAESIVDHNEGNAESLIQPCKEESWPLYRECVTNQEYKIAS